MVPGYDRLAVVHKPLAVHAALEGLGLGMAALKLALGYRPVRQGSLAYWVWRPRCGRKEGLGS